LDSRYSEQYYALAANIAARARKFYRQAGETLPTEDRKAMVAAELMGCVYWRLLRKMERGRFNVFGAQPLKLSKPHKLVLVAQAWLGHASGWQTSNYGRP
jgi:phytoene/squalene synthetase